MLGITCGLYAALKAPRHIWYDPTFMSDHPGGLTRDHVVWAYRLLLDRDPESEDAIGPKLAGPRDTKELRRHLMTSAEFQEKNRDYAHTNDRTVVIKELESGVRLFVDLADHVLRPTIVSGPAVGATGRVYAFEPFDANADLLEQSLHENRFDDRVIFRRAAVGAAAGSATLTFPAETLNTGGAYLLRDGGAPLARHQAKSVPVVALDGLDLRRPVRFIKMDVEGAEPQVIRGAERILREDRPAILSELHPTQLERASGVTADAFLVQMDALGYRAHAIERGE